MITVSMADAAVVVIVASAYVLMVLMYSYGWIQKFIDYTTRRMRLSPRKRVEIVYTNWRNRTERRVVSPLVVWHGRTAYHPENQWFLRAYCHEKHAVRDFAMADIKEWSPASKS